MTGCSRSGSTPGSPAWKACWPHTTTRQDLIANREPPIGAAVETARQPCPRCRGRCSAHAGGRGQRAAFASYAHPQVCGYQLCRSGLADSGHSLEQEQTECRVWLEELATTWARVDAKRQRSDAEQGKRASLRKILPASAAGRNANDSYLVAAAGLSLTIRFTFPGPARPGARGACADRRAETGS